MVDFSKAFDRVDHPILLAKLHNLDGILFKVVSHIEVYWDRFYLLCL